MKRVKSILLVLMISLPLYGCENSSYKKFMEEGKLALASGEYEKAKNMITLANDEKDGKSNEANALISQIDLYNEIMELSQREDLITSNYLQFLIEECEKLEEIKSDTSHMKDKIVTLKAEFENRKEIIIKTEEYIDKRIIEIEEIAEQGDYDEAKRQTNDLFWEVHSYDEGFKPYLDKLQDMADKYYDIIMNKYVDVDSILNENQIEWDPSWSTKADGYND